MEETEPATAYYTLERDNRELQRNFNAGIFYFNYTLERDNRELQLQELR